MKDRNLAYLEREWFHNLPPERAFRHYQRSSTASLRRTLRNHHEESITDSETYVRDDWDYLLGFYGTIEIAVMIGFVRELPKTFLKAHLPILTDPSVRIYYERNYPLDLPRRLRDRLRYGVAHIVEPSAMLNEAFLDYLELTSVIARDPDVESFLWVLDDGYRDDGDQACDLDSVRSALAKPARFATAIQRPATERTEVDRAIVGFTKLIGFTERLGALLDRLWKEPQVAEAIWLAFAYWLREFQTNLHDELRSTIKSLAKWKLPQRTDQQALLKRLKEMEAAFERVSAPPAWDRSAKTTKQGKKQL